MVLLTVSSTFVLSMSSLFILYNWWHGSIPEELCFCGMSSSSLTVLLFTTAAPAFAGSLPTRVGSCVNLYLYKFNTQ